MDTTRERAESVVSHLDTIGFFHLGHLLSINDMIRDRRGPLVTTGTGAESLGRLSEGKVFPLKSKYVAA